GRPHAARFAAHARTGARSRRGSGEGEGPRARAFRAGLTLIRHLTGFPLIPAQAEIRAYLSAIGCPGSLLARGRAEKVRGPTTGEFTAFRRRAGSRSACGPA